MRRLVLILITALLLGYLSSDAIWALTFEQRVQAQWVIERARYSHQVGTTRPFQDVVTQAVVEHKVRTYLQESAALEVVWKTPITEEALRQELERIRANTLDPALLLELNAAFDNNSHIMLETVARSSLVGRLSRNFYAFDRRFHAEARKQADELVVGLRSGTINPHAADPRRKVFEIGSTVADALLNGGSSPSFLNHPSSVSESALDSERLVHPVVERSDAFVVQTVITGSTGSRQLVSYEIPKKPWESWWLEVKARYPSSLDETGTTSRRLPELQKRMQEAVKNMTTSSPTCRPDGTWETRQFDSVPRPLAGHAAIWTGTEMIVWANQRLGGFRYNPNTDTWRGISTVGAPAPDADPYAVAPWGDLLATAVWTGQEMILWDGFKRTGGRYNPDTDTWSPISTQGAPSMRTAFSAVWTGSEMIVWGGRGPTSALNTGARYDPLSDAWQPTSQARAPAPRSSAAVVWTGTTMIVWGGFPSPQADNGAIYDPAIDSWSAMSSTNAGSVGPFPPAIWAGSYMVVAKSSCEPKARRYDPAGNRWLSMACYERNGDRIGSTSRVWTGEEVILWDAENSSGARYTATTDQWRPMSSINSPSDRSLESAVWTGEQMIIWGGDAGSSGGRYNPATDTWTPTAMSAAPEERYGHSAFWTGNEMILWGGHTASQRVTPSGGARYDALTGQWTPMARVGAPVWSGTGASTWTGEELLAWEGALGGGGRYDPLSDSWRPMSITNAPRQENHFALAWTGKEIILWGGRYDPFHDPEEDDIQWQYPREGGRYDPTTDSWNTISAVGAPTGRMDPAPVWTGEELVIWGGLYCYGGFCEGSLGGARYNPRLDRWNTQAFLGSGPVSARPWMPS